MWRLRGVVIRSNYQDASRVIFYQRDHEVQALPPQRAQQPLADGIRLGDSQRGFEQPQPQVAHRLIERRREGAIAIMEQEAVAMSEASCRVAVAASIALWDVRLHGHVGSCRSNVPSPQGYRESEKSL